jgi:hypothetical protein
MDKAQFVANLAFVKKRRTLLYRIALVVLFLILAATMWLSKTHPADHVHAVFKTASTVGYGILVFVFMTVTHRLGRRMGMHCPHCDRNLSGQQSRRVVETDTCVFCGNPLFF